MVKWCGDNFSKRGKAVMLKKVLFWGIVISGSLAVVCFLTLTIFTIIYGDLKVITTDPADPILESYGRYMEKAKYEIYRSVYGKVHLTLAFSILITFALSGLRWYVMNKKDKKPKGDEPEQKQ